jgi:hypothetical protein
MFCFMFLRYFCSQARGQGARGVGLGSLGCEEAEDRRRSSHRREIC